MGGHADVDLACRPPSSRARGPVISHQSRSSESRTVGANRMQHIRDKGGVETNNWISSYINLFKLV